MAYDYFFNYDWQTPFQQAAAAPQPLRQPAPQRLTLEELLAMQDQFTPSPRPKPAATLADLSPAERKQVQQQGLFAGLAAMGASMSSGNWGNAARGVQQVGDIRDQAIAGANARADAEWKKQQVDDAAAAQAAEQHRQTAAVYGMYQRIADAEPPGSPQVSKAEQLAKAGDMAGLAKLQAEEPMRRGARANGLDPDLWDTNTRLQEMVKDELKRRAEAAAWAEGGQQREQAKLADETTAAVTRERAIRALGPAPQAPPQYEPLDRVKARLEMEQQIKAKYEVAKGQTTRLGQLTDGTWAEIRHSTADAPASVTPIPGQPVKVGKLLAYKNSNGEQMVYNPERPELGSVPLAEHQAGEKGAPSVKDLLAPPPKPAAPPATSPAPAAAPNRAPQANDVRNRAVAALLQGGNPEEGVARLRQAFPQGVYGFTPEQVIQSAIAEARRRGWKG